ncbi:unnamed protein product [Candida verbasci]|uniref:Major facilitator superfamily (MFS) profile domain-containing protein n=1 Tax=Candida verbasci TaxID=1227364 RepID=A0A9W4TPR2_9ASCO|nr:unnamed protein product [Candida verbasci]
MGIFGTSKEEEEKLKHVANSNNQQGQRPLSSSQSYSSNTDLSHYETADEEYENEQDAYGHINPENEIINPDQGGFVNEQQNSEIINPDQGGFVNEQQNSDNDDSTIKNQEGDDFNHTKKHEGKHSSSDLDSANPKEYIASNYNENEENRLNRQYTIDRISSHKSIEEAAEDEMRQLEKSNSSKHTNERKELIDVKDLDWDSPDDKSNPHNWRRWKKWVVTYSASVMCLCCSLGSSLYTAGISEIAQKFNASQELCLSGLTFYLIGLAIGPAVAAPLSEVFGRKPLYVLSWPIAMLFIMGVGLAKNIETILVLRFFCGFFSSPALSVAGGTISDIWSNEPSQQSLAVALFCLCPFLGPVLGPIIGGFAAEYKDWQWASSWVLLMFFGAIWPFAILSPETYKPVILARRAKKRGLNVDAPKVNWEFIKKIIKFNLVLPLVLLFTEPIVLFLSLYIAFIFAVLFGFFEAFPVIFRGVYRMDLGISGLPFIGVGIGLCLGVVLYIVLDWLIFFPKNPDGTRGKRDENGKIVWDAPERKLLVGQIGSIFLPIALFWLGWTGRTPSIHWMAPTASGVPFGFGLILVFFSVVLYFAMSFPPMIVASTIAANNLLRYLLASVFPLFTVQMFVNVGIGWAASIFAFIALAMIPVPFLFGYFGPKLRAKSKYSYVAFFKKMKEEKAKKIEQEAKEGKADLPPQTENTVSEKV